MSNQPGHPPRQFPWTALALLAAGLAIAAAIAWQPTRGAKPVGDQQQTNGVVEGPVATVASRVAGVVQTVAVKPGEHVDAGAVLARLDPTPLQTAVDRERAALQVAEAELEQTRSDVRAQAAGAMADWYEIIKQRDQLRQNLAQLRSNQATLKLRQSELTLAESQYQRAVQLAKQRVITADELEQRQAAVQVAQQQVHQAEAQVQQARAGVGLEPAGKSDDIPADLERKFAAIQMSLFAWAQAVAQIGFPIKLDRLEPDAEHAQLPGVKPAPEMKQKLDEWIDTSPAMRLAEAKVGQARARLRAAELDLRGAEIKAATAGVVEQLAIHPGEPVEAGQKLLVLREPDHVWIAATFSQTELGRLAIGRLATVRCTAYPDHVFHGRVATVSAEQPGDRSARAGGDSLVPVRIDFTDEQAAEKPLLAGLAVQVSLEPTASGAAAGNQQAAAAH